MRSLHLKLLCWKEGGWTGGGNGSRRECECESTEPLGGTRGTGGTERRTVVGQSW